MIYAVTYQAHCLARSLRYFASKKAAYPVWPTTAYNALYPTAIPAGRLGPHTPINSQHRQLVIALATDWDRSFQEFNIHSLYWAMSNVPVEVQSDAIAIYQRANSEGTYMKSIETSLSPDVVAKLEMSLASLSQSLLAKDPMMPHHLRNSHQLLITYPESVALLDDQEIATLIGAAQVHTGIEIVKASAAKGGSRKKITADDL